MIEPTDPAQYTHPRDAQAEIRCARAAMHNIEAFTKNHQENIATQNERHKI